MESVRKSLRHTEGTYGIVIMALDAPGELVTARKGSPLILGLGDGESLVASDVAAIVSRTQNVVYLKDGEIAHLTPKNFAITTLSSGSVTAVVDKVTWSIADAEMGEPRAFHGEGDFRAAHGARKCDARTLLRGWQHREIRRAEHFGE